MQHIFSFFHDKGCVSRTSAGKSKVYGYTNRCGEFYRCIGAAGNLRIQYHGFKIILALVIFAKGHNKSKRKIKIYAGSHGSLHALWRLGVPDFLLIFLTLGFSVLISSLYLRFQFFHFIQIILRPIFLILFGQLTAFFR